MVTLENSLTMSYKKIIGLAKWLGIYHKEIEADAHTNKCILAFLVCMLVHNGPKSTFLQ